MFLADDDEEWDVRAKPSGRRDSPIVKRYRTLHERFCDRSWICLAKRQFMMLALYLVGPSPMAWTKHK